MGDWNAKIGTSDLTVMSNKSVRMTLLKLIYIKALLFLKGFIFIKSILFYCVSIFFCSERLK